MFEREGERERGMRGLKITLQLLLRNDNDNKNNAVNSSHTENSFILSLTLYLPTYLGKSCSHAYHLGHGAH